MKAKKRPIEVECYRLKEDNLKELAKWCKGSVRGIKRPASEQIVQWYNQLHQSELEAQVGDWIIKGPRPGDFYPCKNDVFIETYERLD